MPTALPVLPPSADAPRAATAPPSRIAAAADPARKIVRSQELFAGSSQVDIQHGEAIYRLRITALGKLILTK